MLEAPQPFTELDDQALTDVTALPVVTQNNLNAKQNYDRYVELIRWVKGRQQ